MPAPLYTDVSARIRVLVNDLSVPGGANYTDGFCEQFVQPAQESLVNYLIANSVEQLKFRTETPLTVQAGTTILDYPTGGVAGAGIELILPDSLIEPDELWEAKVGGTDQDFVPMTGPITLPRIPQVDTLGYWAWYDGRIHFVGATVNRLVRLAYWADLGNVNPAGRIKLVASTNALATIAASIAARSRGQHDLADRLCTFKDDGTLGGQAGFEAMQIITGYVKSQQAEPVRRRPMFGRDRYSTQNAQIRQRS